MLWEPLELHTHGLQARVEKDPSFDLVSFPSRSFFRSQFALVRFADSHVRPVWRLEQLWEAPWRCWGFGVSEFCGPCLGVRAPRIRDGVRLLSKDAASFREGLSSMSS